MLSCKEVSRLVSDGLDKELPLTTRMGIRLHQIMCRHCARYAKQLKQLRQLVALYEEQGGHPDLKLSDNARQRISCCMDEKLGQ